MIILKVLLGIVIFAVVILLLCGWCKLFEIIKDKFIHTKLYIKWKRSKFRRICENVFFVLLLLIMLVWVIGIGYLIGEAIIR
jgi:hypothetical protein